MAKCITALAMFLLVFTGNAKACDACGCSVNGVGVGLMATYRQNYIGFQYQYLPFRSTLEHGQGSKDYFHSFELAIRYSVLQRLNLQLYQPYHLNIRHSQDGNAQLSGLGDTRFLANYTLFNQTIFSGKMRLYVEAGAGVKAPTGHFNPDLHDQRNLPENFNPGNGSWAGLAQANIVLNRDNGGLLLTANYQHSRPASNGYRFGHQWSGQALVFNQFQFKGKPSLAPFTGVSVEKTFQDMEADGKYAASTGGHAMYLAFGTNLRYEDWLLGISYAEPISQHISNAEVEAKGRLTVQFSHIF
ncbi:MAG: hypothetical protein GC192_23885 [Bacteroidetes bacterium]|nr:hypothetical protein [Bacteroidota bacterium]